MGFCCMRWGCAVTGHLGWGICYNCRFSLLDTYVGISSAMAACVGACAWPQLGFGEALAAGGPIHTRPGSRSRSSCNSDGAGTCGGSGGSAGSAPAEAGGLVSVAILAVVEVNGSSSECTRHSQRVAKLQEQFHMLFTQLLLLLRVLVELLRHAARLSVPSWP